VDRWCQCKLEDEMGMWEESAVAVNQLPRRIYVRTAPLLQLNHHSLQHNHDKVHSSRHCKALRGVQNCAIDEVVSQ